MNQSFRLRYVNEVVGGFVVMVLALLMAVIGGVVHRQGWLVAEFDVVAVTLQKEATGLNKGADVLLLGKRIGEVTSLEYGDQDEGANQRTLKVTLSLKENYRGRVFKDSVALIRRHMAGAGEAYFDIIQGDGREKHVIQPGDKLRVETANSATSEIEKVVDSVGEIVVTVGQAGKDFALIRQSIKDAADGVDVAAKSLHDASRVTQEEFPRLVDNVALARKAVQEFQESADPTLRELKLAAAAVAESSTDAADALTKSASSFTAHISDISDAAVPALNQLETTGKELQDSNDVLLRILLDAEKIVPRIEPILDDTETFLGDATEISRILKGEVRQLPGTVQKVQTTLGDAQEIANGLKRHWMLRRYIDQSGGTREIAPSRLGRGGR